MYESFFGLECEPFSVAPDPRFLYLSEQHKQALEHLEYGLQRGGGFVLLTGEIGAGKTTVWRPSSKVCPELRRRLVVNPRLGVDALLRGSARTCASSRPA
jgi:general secretion pathway protein A